MLVLWFCSWCLRPVMLEMWCCRCVTERPRRCSPVTSCAVTKCKVIEWYASLCWRLWRSDTCVSPGGNVQTTWQWHACVGWMARPGFFKCTEHQCLCSKFETWYCFFFLTFSSSSCSSAQLCQFLSCVACDHQLIWHECLAQAKQLVCTRCNLSLFRTSWPSRVALWRTTVSIFFFGDSQNTVGKREKKSEVKQKEDTQKRRWRKKRTRKHEMEK